MIGKRAGRFRRLAALSGEGGLLLVSSVCAVMVLFIFYYILRDALPFFRAHGFKEFFTARKWYPSADPPSFGALTIFYGSAMVTLGAMVFAMPVGIAAAVCLSDILPFSLRQAVKPIIEMLAAIPSVAYGFWAFVVFAPLLQNHGGKVLEWGWLAVISPLALLVGVVVGDLGTTPIRSKARVPARVALTLIAWGALFALLLWVGDVLGGLQIASGTNALNASIVLGIMALPTVVSVSEDALSAVGRSLREGSYALGATRAETIIRVVIPSARSGIVAAVILGIMRAVGETMVVWMASGNAAQIPSPWYNFLEPVRTLTATIAGEMGEADQVTGSGRYHVLFAMALCLLTFSFICNLVSEWAMRRSRMNGG